MKKSFLLFTALMLWMPCLAHAASLSAAFTYQGRLIDNGSPANGAYDMRFTLYSASTGTNNQVGGTIQIASVLVTNGLFKEELDFSASPFDGEDRWLEIGVRPGGSTNSFTVLDPRQRLSPSPYALFAPNAAMANGVATSAISATQLNTPGLPATGQVLAYGGIGLVWTNASAAAAAWTLNGNSGTMPGVNFLGTSDNQPLEIKVNGTRAFRLEPNGNGAPNVIGGKANNQVSGGGVGATVGGGQLNTIQKADNATISGGGGNIIANASNTTIGGGSGNSIQSDSDWGSISGGFVNTIESGVFFATISGGENHTIQANALGATIAGGSSSTIESSSSYAAIGGGSQNRIQTRGGWSTIGGGSFNTVQSNAQFSTIPGGEHCTAAGNSSFAAGCHANAKHNGAFVWADSSGFFDFPSSQTNEFAARATGGVRFVSGVDSNGVPVAGVALPAGSGSWSSLSDRSAKTNFAPVNSRELLDRLAQLPIQTWNYKSQSESVRHIGPTAQDFHAAFAVGEDDRHIATVDEAGVALAAIQGLNHRLTEELNRRDGEIQELRQQLNELKTALWKKSEQTR